MRPNRTRLGRCTPYLIADPPIVRTPEVRAPHVARARVPLLVAVLVALLAPLAHAEGRWELRVCGDPIGMPMSSRDGGGFENAIAEIVADELGADLVYDWYPYGADMIDLRFRAGHCDVVMGVPEGQEPFLSSLAYYRTSYAFVYRADAPFAVASFDDPVLADLRVAIQAIGIPPHVALRNRGLGGNVVAQFGREATADRADPRAQVLETLLDGTADVAIASGPIAGYYGARLGVPLVVVPVAPSFEPPFVTQVVSMTVGVRRGDEALRDAIGVALARRWDDVQAVLERFDVVTLPLPRPNPPRELP